MSAESFFDGCLAFCADLVFTGGMATVATGLYDAYNKCTDAIDMGSFLRKTKREQAKLLLSTGHFGSEVAGMSDAIGGEVYEDLKNWGKI